MLSILTLFGALALLGSTKADKDDYYGDDECYDVCENYCFIEELLYEYEYYDDCLATCAEDYEDYYDYYYGEYYGDYDERADKQMKVRPDKMKIRQREDDYSDYYDGCFTPCEDWCWVAAFFDYGLDYD